MNCRGIRGDVRATRLHVVAGNWIAVIGGSIICGHDLCALIRGYQVIRHIEW